MTEKDNNYVKTVKIDGCIHKKLKLFALENDLSISDVINALLHCADKNGLDVSYGYAANVICNEPPHPSITPNSTGNPENADECPASNITHIYDSNDEDDEIIGIKGV